MSYLQIDDVTYTYPQAPEPVISGLNCQLDRGKTLAVLGDSGCGKSTLLRLISGLARCDSGRISIDGVTMDGPGGFIEPEKRGVGMVFQEYALFPHMTVLKNVKYGLFTHSAEQRKTLAEEALARVHLSEHAQKYPHQLSGGQQQRVALARALAPQPRLLLLDEPFSNLDTNLRADIRADVNSILRESATTTLLVTHDREDAQAVADHTLEMRA